MSFDIQQQLLKQRRTRIVATAGPASSDGATLATLIRAGADQTEAVLWRRGAFESILDSPLRPAPIPLAEAVAKSTARIRNRNES